MDLKTRAGNVILHFLENVKVCSLRSINFVLFGNGRPTIKES